MTKSISDDLRFRVIVAVDAGLSRRAAAERFGVGTASAIRWVREWRETGSARAKPQGDDRRSQRIEAYRTAILMAVEDQVDITLVEIAAMLRTDHGAIFAASTNWRFLDRHAMTFKKTAHANEQKRHDVAMRRQAWFDAQPVEDDDVYRSAATVRYDRTHGPGWAYDGRMVRCLCRADTCADAATGRRRDPRQSPRPQKRCCSGSH